MTIARKLLGMALLGFLLTPAVSVADAAATETRPTAATPSAIAASAPRSGDSASADILQIRTDEKDPLINAGGRPWREWRNGPVKIVGGLLVVAALVAVWAFHRRTGGIRLQGAPSGRYLVRFDGFERVAHWITALSFILLAASGLVLLSGRNLLLPVIGYDAFSWLAGLCKNSHNFLGLVFLGGIAVMFLVFLRDNFWHASDRLWLQERGGLFSHAHVPSGRFNAGEKIWFWGGMTALGLLLVVTGLALDFANLLPSPIYAQAANLLHGAGALLLIAASFGHIYMGTIGVEGAYQAMITGEVDETWAKEHHSIRFDERRRPAAKKGA